MKKFSFLLLAMLALAVFLRVYGMPGNYYFSGELGKELLYMRQFSMSQTLPLVGMSTSHEWLSYGPIYYWIMIPIFNLFNGNPFILFYSTLVVALIGLVLNYWVMEKIVGGKVALISTVIQAISPLFIWRTQLSKLHVFFWILAPLYMYLLYLLWNGKMKWVIWTGIVFGIMFSFHFSQIPLLGVAVGLFIIKRYRPIEWLKFGLGVVIPNITFLWQDKSLIAWIPYRVITFAGRNLAGTIQSFNEFLGRILFRDQKLWVMGSLVFLITFIHFICSRRKIIKEDFLTFFITLSVSFIFLANFLHDSPPVHYFLSISVIVTVLLALYLDKMKYWWFPLVVLFLINLNGYFNFQKPDDFVSFGSQIKLVDSIITDAEGTPFYIKRIGLSDYFPDNYSQNYKYLILWRGGKLTDSRRAVYTINDYTNSYSKEK